MASGKNSELFQYACACFYSGNVVTLTRLKGIIHFKLKTMKKGIWVLGLCCLALAACKEEKHPQLPRTASGKLVYMVVDSLLTEQERELKAEYIHLVPDYLLTEEEEEVKQARLKKWKEEVEDKHFQFDSTTKLQAFDMTLEEFLQTGFQEAEYWAFKAKIARNNQWVKDTMPKLQAKWKAFAQIGRNRFHIGGLASGVVLHQRGKNHPGMGS